jgi:hypothetical protein
MQPDMSQTAPAIASKTRLMTFAHIDGRTRAKRQAKRIARAIQRQLG